ncbi:MAG: AAA family ATPase, partial [Verrucomicrobiae bacterium]|nr:AAA family ATPase [Verrucomicrobiae bacterium]
MPERIAQRFEPLALLSESPIAQEFRARDLREGGEVALKLIRPETCRRSPENFFRYRRLLRECAPIRHPNLSAIVDTGEWNGGEYVAFEWTDALRFCDRTDRATVDEAIEIMRAVCHGLEAAHSRGVLHGLLNAESVLLALDLERVAQIRDFGIGLLLDLTRIREKADVRRIFRYLAPEQSGILRKPADGRSDLYSMGILFYELLAGAPPYESDEVNVLVSQHVSRAPQSLRERNEDTPRVLEQIVFKLIAKDPDDRYQTVGGVLADLDALAQRRLEGRGGEFEIGLQDKLRKPSFSTRLIGREAELNRLRTALQLTRGSGSSVVFIHGEPGIGKTRLINELRAEVHGMGGLFIGGKCSQYDAGSPFKVLSMAIESYVERVRRLDVEEQDRHRARIREGVGELGREIMKLTPRVEELIGKAPALAELEPDQQRTRFLVTVVNFLAGLGAPGQPLVIFLEDL